MPFVFPIRAREAQPPRDQPQQHVAHTTFRNTWHAEPCCEKECAWWVVSWNYLASTWPDQESANIEAMRLNATSASGMQAVR